MAPVSLSSEAEYQRGYGPVIRMDLERLILEIDELKATINENAAAV